MNIIVVYKSITGFTERYAGWIAEELKCSSISYDDSLQLSDYDIVIFGSRVHAGRIDGLSKIKKQTSNSSNTRLIVFATGATPCDATDVINTIWQNNFTEDELTRIPHYYMQSGLNYNKMKLGDRLIMKTMAFLLSKKKDKSADELGSLESIQSSHDISSKDYIGELVNYIKQNCPINMEQMKDYRC